jgi:hypothetical protein
MSPEQERGEILTPASDVYTLGVVLYECLSGSRPTLGGYRRLSSLNESIPPAADTLIQACLRDDPQQRLQSAAEFAVRLNRAVEPHATFSDTLTQGSLHEIQIALGAMTPSTYARLPIGQRLAVMTRLRDLVRVDEARLNNALASLLTEVVRVAHSSRTVDYEFVVKQGLVFGYEHKYSEVWTGNGALRDSLSEVARLVEVAAHTVVCVALFSHLATASLEGRQGWYLHDLRILAENLLANVECSGENAEKLAVLVDDLNARRH